MDLVSAHTIRGVGQPARDGQAHGEVQVEGGAAIRTQAGQGPADGAVGRRRRRAPAAAQGKSRTRRECIGDEESGQGPHRATIVHREAIAQALTGSDRIRLGRFVYREGVGKHRDRDGGRGSAGIGVGDGQGDGVRAGCGVDVTEVGSRAGDAIAEGPSVVIGRPPAEPVGADAEVDRLPFEGLVGAGVDDDGTGVNPVTEHRPVEDRRLIVAAGVAHAHRQRVASPVQETGVGDFDPCHAAAFVAGHPADDVAVQPDRGGAIGDGGAVGGVEQVYHDAAVGQSALGVGPGVDGQAEVLAQEEVLGSRAGGDGVAVVVICAIVTPGIGGTVTGVVLERPRCAAPDMVAAVVQKRGDLATRRPRRRAQHRVSVLPARSVEEAGAPAGGRVRHAVLNQSPVHVGAGLALVADDDQGVGVRGCGRSRTEQQGDQPHTGQHQRTDEEASFAHRRSPCSCIARSSG